MVSGSGFGWFGFGVLWWVFMNLVFWLPVVWWFAVGLGYKFRVLLGCFGCG